MREALVQSARQTLGLFAEKGYETLGGFVEQSVPEAERGQAVDVLVRILQGLAFGGLGACTASAPASLRWS